MLKKILSKDEMYLHKKRISIPKLTPKKWKDLFGVVDKIPGLIFQVLSVPKEDFYANALVAVELAFDEVIEIVSILSGVDTVYIEENVGIDELIEFLARTVKKNRLDTIPKNVKSLLPKAKRSKQEKAL